MQTDVTILGTDYTIEFEVKIITHPQPPIIDYLDGGDPGVDLEFEITAAEIEGETTPAWLSTTLCEYLQESRAVAEQISTAIENGEL